MLEPDERPRNPSPIPGCWGLLPAFLLGALAPASQRGRPAGGGLGLRLSQHLACKFCQLPVCDSVSPRCKGRVTTQGHMKARCRMTESTACPCPFLPNPTRLPASFQIPPLHALCSLSRLPLLSPGHTLCFPISVSLLWNALFESLSPPILPPSSPFQTPVQAASPDLPVVRPLLGTPTAQMLFQE